MGKKRHINRGVEKRCMCRRSSWSQCPHPWTFRYKPRGHGRQQLSLDRLLGYHVDSRTDADKHANRIRTEMDAGTFRKDSVASPVSSGGVWCSRGAKAPNRPPASAPCETYSA
jgi:hypothetical protein